MNELRWFVWIFPLLFIIHDMEEIICAKKWCGQQYKKYVSIPITPFGNTKSTAALSLAVYEELILMCLITGISALTDYYLLWFGVLVANIIHLFLLHIILLQVAYRRYVPGVITAWITLIPCCYILYLSQNILHFSVLELILSSVVGLIIVSLNVKFLHGSINKWANILGL